MVGGRLWWVERGCGWWKEVVVGRWRGVVVGGWRGVVVGGWRGVVVVEEWCNECKKLLKNIYPKILKTLPTSTPSTTHCDLVDDFDTILQMSRHGKGPYGYVTEFSTFFMTSLMFHVM